MLCLSSQNLASEGRTEAGYIFLFSGRILYGCQWDSGRVSVSKCFRLYSTDGQLGFISKKTTTKNDLVLYTLFI